MSDRLFDVEPEPTSFWNAEHAAAGQLTIEVLQKAFDSVRNQQYEPHPCKLGHHIVSASAKRRLADGGTARCVECLTLLGPYKT